MIQSRGLKARLIPLALLAGFVATASCGGSGATPAPPGYAGCASQEAACESSCEPREMPGSSEKEPFARGNLEAERCRERCRSSGCTGP